MYILIVILIAVVCLMLMFAVLIQNPKGGGLGAGFANIGNQVMGARRTNDFMEKITWGLVIVLLVLSLGSAMVMPKQTTAIEGEAPSSTIQDRVAPDVSPALTLPDAAKQPPVTNTPPVNDAPPVEGEGDGGEE